MADELTDDQLLERLKEAFESWPLYRTLHYTGADLSYLPAEISLFCSNCKNTQRWQRYSQFGRFDPAGNSRTGFTSEQYRCRNCAFSVVQYYFYWGKDRNGAGSFFKTGQWPSIDESIRTELEDRLDKEDLDFYKKAIRLRNHGLGVGALAYLRRVVENRINDILDVLAEAAKEHDFAAEELKTIEAVKGSHRFDDKITYAAKLLPTHLQPKGKPNPIDRLHELASEGLHSKSEDECLAIFDNVRRVFEYVFGKLTVQVDDAREFVKSLEKIAAPKTK
ncbi:MAG: hypothetical protein ACLPVW_07300 [Terriglobales bacterium]